MANVKKQDPETGKIYIVDADDNIIEEAPVADKLFTTTPGKESVLKAPTSADQFYNAFGRYVKPTLTGAGSITGALLGGASSGPLAPLGAYKGGMFGTAAGSAVGSGLQAMFPDWYGQYEPQTPMESVTDVAKDVVLDKIFNIPKALTGGFPSVRKELLENLAERFGVKHIIPQMDKETLKAVNADTNFPVSLGQLNRGLARYENYPAKAQLLKNQNDFITRALRGFRPDKTQEGIIRSTIPAAKAQAQNLKRTVKAEYEAFEPFKAQNTRQIKVELPPKPSGLFDPQGNEIMTPQFKIEDVEGAIPLKSSKNFVDPIIKQLDEELGPNAANPEWLGANYGNPLVKLKATLENIGNVKTHLDPATNAPYANPISSFKQLQTIRDSISSFKDAPLDRGVKERLRASLAGLEATIRKDIDEGVQEWGKPAYNQFRTAQRAAKNKALRADNKLAQQLLNTGTDPNKPYEAVAKNALSDPVKTRQFILSTWR